MHINKIFKLVENKSGYLMLSDVDITRNFTNSDINDKSNNMDILSYLS